MVYHSSTWEQLWLNNIHEWQNGRICEAIASQTDQIRRFMNSTCMTRTDTPWCLIGDNGHRFWYHTGNGRVQRRKPHAVRQNPKGYRPELPSDASIWSYFEWTDRTGATQREYIEPLVSHLRHPIAVCQHGHEFNVDRSYVLPPAKRAHRRKALLFDAGASSWHSGLGGASLSYYAEVWSRYGITWSHVEAWECTVPEPEFYKTVPKEWKPKVLYHQKCIATSPAKEPFVPSVIRQRATKEDYVLFKLDIDSKAVETAIVDFLLRSDKHLALIDEFVWEHHVDNYLMARYWKDTADTTKTIADSYGYFLELRRRGVRAHSWV